MEYEDTKKSNRFTSNTEIILLILNRFLNLKSLHALNISLNFATPVGSTIILSGLNLFIISSIEESKSPDELQQIHPAVISSTSTPVFFLSMSVSIPTFPNSFSKTTIFRHYNLQSQVFL